MRFPDSCCSLNTNYVRICVSFVVSFGVLCPSPATGIPRQQKCSVLPWSCCRKMFRYSGQDGYKPLSHRTVVLLLKFSPLRLLTTVAILLSTYWVSWLPEETSAGNNLLLKENESPSAASTAGNSCKANLNGGIIHEL